MPSKMQGKKVNRFCERCGAEEFEGYVFGKYKTTRLTMQADGSGLICQKCKALHTRRTTRSTTHPEVTSKFRRFQSNDSLSVFELIAKSKEA